MRRILFIILIILVLPAVLLIKSILPTAQTGAPPYAIEDLEPPTEDRYARITNWKRPEGRAKVGLQVGHWKNDELPEELSRLRGNTGATGGGKTESEVNYQIATLTQQILEDRGIEVEILPSTIPKDFWADVFVSIHADGSLDTTASGYKIAHPRRDFSGNAEILLDLVKQSYYEETNMSWDDNISRNMTGYYAFAWWRYEHSVHPKTASIILETGFLTSPKDRNIIVKNPEKSAKGLANGIIEFLDKQKLL